VYRRPPPQIDNLRWMGTIVWFSIHGPRCPWEPMRAGGCRRLTTPCRPPQSHWPARRISGQPRSRGRQRPEGGGRSVASANGSRERGGDWRTRPYFIRCQRPCADLDVLRRRHAGPWVWQGCQPTGLCRLRRPRNRKRQAVAHSQA